MRYFLGGTSRLLKAIGSHPSLQRACNVLTAPLIAGRVPIPLPQIPLQTLALPSVQISISASTPNLCPTPKHAIHPPPRRARPSSVIPLAPSEIEGGRGTIGLKLCHPDRSGRHFLPRRTLVRRPRSGGTPATKQAIHDPMNPAPLRFFPRLHALPIHSLFLSFAFIFPLVEIPFSI